MLIWIHVLEWSHDRRSLHLEDKRKLGLCIQFLTIGVVVQTVDAEEGVVVFDLFGSDLCHCLDRVQPAVLSKRHRDDL